MVVWGEGWLLCGGLLVAVWGACWLLCGGLVADVVCRHAAGHPCCLVEGFWLLRGVLWFVGGRAFAVARGRHGLHVC